MIVYFRQKNKTQELNSLISLSKNIENKKIEVCVLNNLYSIHEYLLSKINNRYFNRKIKFFNTQKTLIRYVSKYNNAIGFVSSVNHTSYPGQILVMALFVE